MPKPVQELLEAERYPWQVATGTRPQDIDANQHINNVALIAMSADARTRFLRAAGIGLPGQPLAATLIIDEMEYLNEALYPDQISFSVGVAERGPASISLAILATQHGRPVAFARNVLALETGDATKADIDHMNAALEMQRIRFDGALPASRPPQASLLDAARYPARVEITTRFQDAEPDFHLGIVALAAMLEDARVRMNVKRDDRIRGGSRLVVASSHIHLLSKGFYPHPVELHTGILSIGRSSWTSAALAMQNGVPIAYSEGISVATVPGGGTMQLLPAFVEMLEQKLLAPSLSQTGNSVQSASV